MASIIPIDGRFRATVRIKRDGKLVFNKSTTHDTRRLAEQWAQEVEVKARTEAGLAELTSATGLRGLKVAKLIEMYEEYIQPLKPLGETKRAVLRVLRESSLGKRDCVDVTSAVIVEYCRSRRDDHGNGPATVAQYFGYLRQPFDIARPVWGLGLDGSAFDEARPILADLGLIGQGEERDRRLEGNEYARLLAWFEEYDRSRARKLRMAPVFRYAVALAPRLGEIVGIRRSDVNHERRTVIVRDRKDPRKKIGNDQEIPLLGVAWDIVCEQMASHSYELIFPYGEESVSACFSRACEALGIEDLTFHDMRHEGTSRLFEAGYSIEQVALVTGHKNWRTLKRYLKLRPATLHHLPAAANLGGTPFAVSGIESVTAPLPSGVKRRRWVVKTPDGYLVQAGGELGFVDAAEEAELFPDEEKARQFGDESGEPFEVERVLVQT
jgi:integrase